MSSANIVSGAAIRIPNNTSVARDFKNIRDLTLVSLDTTDDVHIGAGASHVDIDTTAVFVQGAKVAGAFQVNTGWFGTNAPVVTPASTYTVGLTDNYIIFNGSGSLSHSQSQATSRAECCISLQKLQQLSYQHRQMLPH